MTKIRNAVMSFAIMYSSILLVLAGFEGIKTGYDIEETETNIFQRLSEINLLAGISDIGDAIERIAKVQNPADLLGGLAIGALGILQTLGGLVTFPIDISIAISPSYGVIFHPILAHLIGLLGIITIGFILLSAKMGWEL